MNAKGISRSLGVMMVAGSASFYAYRRVVRPWQLRWGASDAEVTRPLPGDEEVQRPTLSATRAVTVYARADEVWPWLAQIGKGRAGFYSYEWIENLMGLEIENADHILPEIPPLNAGDIVPGFWPVKAVEVNRYLLFAGKEPWGEVSWVLALAPLDASRTRLISRTRYRLRWGTLLRTLPIRMVPFYLFFEPGEFVMLRKMLLGIKRRAEMQATGQGAPLENPATVEAESAYTKLP